MFYLCPLNTINIISKYCDVYTLDSQLVDLVTALSFIHSDAKMFLVLSVSWVMRCGSFCREWVLVFHLEWVLVFHFVLLVNQPLIPMGTCICQLFLSIDAYIFCCTNCASELVFLLKCIWTSFTSSCHLLMMLSL